MLNCMTIDVEDWFHVLDTPAAPRMGRWDALPCRVDRNTSVLLEALDRRGVRATFFWLGWVARRHRQLVRRCIRAGHEVASHGFAHVLPYKAGPEAFGTDIIAGKQVLEDITGRRVRGFRAPGFGITGAAEWAMEVIRQAGYDYDASVFPTARGHGGMPDSPMAPHVIETPSGPLVECPMSVVEVMGRRVCLFSGGYLRTAPIPIIRWGAQRLHRAGRPLIVLVHPREIDPDHPRLPLGLKRRFKCYVNLKSTLGKFEWLCGRYPFVPMCELADSVRRPVAVPAAATAA